MTRGTGITTRQILAAPYGAVYICGNSRERRYVEDLARCHARQDLRLMDLNDALYGGGDRFIGSRRFVVLDHAALEHASPGQRESWRYVSEYLIRHRLMSP